MLSTTHNTQANTHIYNTQRNFWKFMLIKKFVGFLQTANYFLLHGVQKNCSYFFKQIDFISIKFKWTLFIMGEERLFILTFKENRENVLFCWPHSPSLPRPFAEFRVQKIWTIFPQFTSLQYCGFQPDSALLVLTLLCLCVCVCALYRVVVVELRWIAPSTPLPWYEEKKRLTYFRWNGFLLVAQMRISILKKSYKTEVLL